MKCMFSALSIRRALSNQNKVGQNSWAVSAVLFEVGRKLLRNFLKVFSFSVAKKKKKKSRVVNVVYFLRQNAIFECVFKNHKQ